MAFAENSEVFALKEGLLKKVVYTNPQDIGTNTSSILTFISAEETLSFIKQGTIVVNINRTYAEFKARTPAQMIRKDIIEKQFSIGFEAGQLDADITELLKGTNSQKGLATSVPDAQTWDIHHMGPDEPVQAARGYLLDGNLTNGNRFMIGIYFGRVLTEDNSMTFAGTDYVVQPGEIVAFPNPSHTGTANEDEKKYGFIARQVS